MTSVRGCAMLVALATPVFAGAQPAPALPLITTHDNVKPAGILKDGALRLSLWAGMGQWRPKGPASDGLTVAAFGEEGKPLSIPSPLIRMPAGTVISAAIRNTLAAPLWLRGFCDRPGACQPLVIAPGETREVRFAVKTAGTFHYWGAMSQGNLGARGSDDTQLGGAIVADAAGAVVEDRVFILGRRGDPSRAPGTTITVINGRSWPHTERLMYTTGKAVRWRVVNLSNIAHAMHLHGFFFDVDSVGDGMSDTRYADANRRQAVTEHLGSGNTMAMTWVPERPGNWLFHCHMLAHMMAPDALHSRPGASHESGDASGMAGLVLGIHVTGGDRTSPPKPGAPVRALQLAINHDTRLGSAPSYKLDLTMAGGATAPRLNAQGAPGPVMVLTRGEPVAVEVVNRLREPTAIHWHGIELESYHDGVPGFGGTAGSVTPPIAPAGRFTARFTPSRAGTFIYHTHWHDPGQLAGGIYGPIVVLEPGETYVPERDHIILIGLEGAYPAKDPLNDEPFAINGERTPGELELERDVPHRLRVINITGDAVALTVQFSARFDPMTWTLIGKDGAATPAAQRTSRPARQLVSVGETYDFEIPPLTSGYGALWLELRRANGEQLLQWPVRLR